MNSRLAISLLTLGLMSASVQPVRGIEDAGRVRIAARPVKKDAPMALISASCAMDTKRNRMLIYGRDGNAADATLLAFDLRDDTWSTLEFEGDSPQATGKPGLAYVASEDALYLFAGWQERAPEPSKEMWRLDLSADGPLEWKQMLRSGDWPPARNGMCFVADEPRGRLLLHGGDGGTHRKYGYTPLADLWSYDLKARKWKQLRPSGDAPLHRWNHTAAIDAEGGRMFLFGGAGYTEDPEGQVKDADIYMLDLKALKWTKSPKQERTPKPVQGTSLTYDSQAEALVVVGGLTMEKDEKPGTKRIYAYDLKQQKWVRTKEMLNEKRRDHVAVYDPKGRRHVIYGGHTCVEDGNYYRPGQPLANAIQIRLERTKAEE